VTGEGLPLETSTWNDNDTNAAPLKLSGLATTPGKTAANLKPLQLHGWFVFVQSLPIVALLILWQWDRRRRFLEAHPEIVRRLQARRALKCERKLIRDAIIAADENLFATHAAAAMRIAVAPHFPADARALVGSDVLDQLDAAQRDSSEGATVRKIFAAVDAQFNREAGELVSLSLAPEVENILQKLEAKL
jgi:hypothetical protein